MLQRMDMFMQQHTADLVQNSLIISVLAVGHLFDVVMAQSDNSVVLLVCGICETLCQHERSSRTACRKRTSNSSSMQRILRCSKRRGNEWSGYSRASIVSTNCDSSSAGSGINRLKTDGPDSASGNKRDSGEANSMTLRLGKGAVGVGCGLLGMSAGRLQDAGWTSTAMQSNHSSSSHTKRRGLPQTRSTRIKQLLVDLWNRKS